MPCAVYEIAAVFTVEKRLSRLLCASSRFLRISQVLVRTSLQQNAQAKTHAVANWHCLRMERQWEQWSPSMLMKSHSELNRMQLPETRPSILDPRLENEPWIDKCPSTNTLVLFLHNHPIAVIAGSSLESVSLAMRLS